MRLFFFILFISANFFSRAQDLIYDFKGWKFDAAAPVRSTPLVKGNNVFIGTTRGDLFCLNKKTGQVKWKFHSVHAINSSAAWQNGKIFFADNEQAVYALDANTGKQLWKFRMGSKLKYDWGFDYFFSSPTLYQNKLMIGSDDGYVYQLDQQTGKLIWKFQCRGVVRSTGAIYKNNILFGDNEARVYAINITTGKRSWEYVSTGDTMKNEDFGFDRRAIISSPVISGNKAVFGSREGFLYCINADDGSFQWKVDHEVSWIVSTVAIKDSFIVTGTSDGRFIQAVNLYTGKEIWKYKTPLAVWSSPLIDNNKVYAGGYDGQLYCLDLKTGKRISSFCTNGIIYSSPVINDSLLYVGSDDGNLYALKGHRPRNMFLSKRFVYAEKQPALYYKAGSADRIRTYLVNNGYKNIEADTLSGIFSQLSDAPNTVVVIASNYLPADLPIRKFLDAGGRIVVAGTNPLFFTVDSAKRATGLSFPKATEVFGIDFGPNDTRAFGGLYPSFPTEKGRELNLPDHWVSNFGYDPKLFDVVLGINEKGLATAFVKNYNKRGRFIQIWMHQDIPTNLDAIMKAGDWEF